MKRDDSIPRVKDSDTGSEIFQAKPSVIPLLIRSGTDFGGHLLSPGIEVVFHQACVTFRLGTVECIRSMQYHHWIKRLRYVGVEYVNT